MDFISWTVLTNNSSMMPLTIQRSFTEKRIWSNIISIWSIRCLIHLQAKFMKRWELITNGPNIYLVLLTTQTMKALLWMFVIQVVVDSLLACSHSFWNGDCTNKRAWSIQIDTNTLDTISILLINSHIHVDILTQTKQYIVVQEMLRMLDLDFSSLGAEKRN